MAITIKVVKYEQDENDASKTMVGFDITDTNIPNITKAIDSSVTTGSKTSDQISTEAYTAIASRVTAWQTANANLGKTFDPDTGRLV